MSTLLVTAKLMKWNWEGWIRGVVSAFIVGGTGSVGAGIGGLWSDPQQYNPTTGVSPLLKLMGATFLFTGIISLAAYLHNHPIPDYWDGINRREGD